MKSYKNKKLKLTVYYKINCSCGKITCEMDITISFYRFVLDVIININNSYDSQYPEHYDLEGV